LKKVTYHKYGAPDVLSVEEASIPEPSENEVLVKIMAAGINPVDYKIRNGSIRFIVPGSFPRTPGGEIAGIVEKNGPGSKFFKAGEKVFAMLGLRGGGYSEYLCVKEELISRIPDNIDFDHAAAIPLAGLTALQALRDKGEIKAGMEVLINGGSGGVGMFAIQIARFYGANVTATCSGKNLEFVSKLGASKGINYQKDDFSKLQQKYDIVFDAVAKTSFSKCRNVLKNEGIFITTVPDPVTMFYQVTNGVRKQKAYNIMCKPGRRDLDVLSEIVNQEKLFAHLDKVYELEQAVQAHQYIETGRVKGKLVIKMRH
jgi:NADPH:quinone reductase-like Zn-dependent oxidoreductase